MKNRLFRGNFVSFDWLNNFQQDMHKPANYAEKTLAAYKLGMKARGSIAGIRIVIDPEGCAACKELNTVAIYHPDDAPILPLPQCDRSQKCGCIYRPVMTYQLDDEEK